MEEAHLDDQILINTTRIQKPESKKYISILDL